MNLKMNVLKNNEKLRIDNRLISFNEIHQNLKEEYREVVLELQDMTQRGDLASLKNLISETFDLIQMCVLILDKCNKYADLIDENRIIENMNKEHNDKLKERGWETGAEINIEIKERL